jgi:hypothetical protein
VAVVPPPARSSVPKPRRRLHDRAPMDWAAFVKRCYVVVPGSVREAMPAPSSSTPLSEAGSHHLMARVTSAGGASPASRPGMNPASLATSNAV